MRHIRLFVQAIAKVVGLIKAGDPDFALETIRTTFHDLLGTSLDDFLAFPDDRILDFLTFGEVGQLGMSKAGLAANLLMQAGAAWRLKDQPQEAAACFDKSIRLLLEVHLAEGEGQPPLLPEFAPPLEDILAEVAPAGLSADTLGALVFYFEKQAAYGRADGFLHAMLAKAPTDADTLAFGRSFYEYLLEESDENLETGGLPRPQILAALARLL